MRPTDEEIKAREVVEIDQGEYPDREVWKVEYTKDAYTDQLGLSHSAWVVYERIIVHVTARYEQFEYYSETWHKSGAVGHSDDGRKWRYHANLVDYTGGGTWKVVEDPRTVPMGYMETPGFYRNPPWSKTGEAPKGYMLPDGSPATKLKEES